MPKKWRGHEHCLSSVWFCHGAALTKATQMVRRKHVYSLDSAKKKKKKKTRLPACRAQPSPSPGHSLNSAATIVAGFVSFEVLDAKIVCIISHVSATVRWEADQTQSTLPRHPYKIRITSSKKSPFSTTTLDYVDPFTTDCPWPKDHS